MMAADRRSPIPVHVPPGLVVDFDVYEPPEGRRDFHLAWKRLQDSAPGDLVWTPRNGGHWIALRGRDIQAMYADHEHLSSKIVIVPREWNEGFRLRPTTLDPPEHQPYRALMNAGLSPKAVRPLHSVIREVAAMTIEGFRDRGACDFISDYAEILPIRVFFELANLPIEHAKALRPLAIQLVRPDGSISSAEIMDRFHDYLRPFVAERRANPGTDLLSRIVNGLVNGRPLDDDEALEVCTVVLSGGLDTVASFLGFMMIFLAGSPAHRRQLQEDPGLIPSAVDEFLRRFPIVVKARLVTRDYVYDGIALKADDIVVVPPLHGLDDREYDRPLEVDFKRPATVHSTFGSGVHRCPGALLAHAEVAITLEEWMSRIPEFALDLDKPHETRAGFLGAVVTLPLTWDPARPRAAVRPGAACPV